MQTLKKEEVQPVTEETTETTEEKGLSMVNILLYILGAIAVIAAGIYFFMRREPTPKSAADIARAQSQQDPAPEPQEEPAQEETYSEPEPQPEPEQPVQEETPTETTEEQSKTDNTNQSSNNDDENNNRELINLYPSKNADFQNRCFQPLSHLSVS